MIIRKKDTMILIHAKQMNGCRWRAASEDFAGLGRLSRWDINTLRSKFWELTSMSRRRVHRSKPHWHCPFSGAPVPGHQCHSE